MLRVSRSVSQRANLPGARLGGLPTHATDGAVPTALADPGESNVGRRGLGRHMVAEAGRNAERGTAGGR
eukprot:11187945-Lingulodinium_polyedra.AAC.1